MKKTIFTFIALACFLASCNNDKPAVQDHSVITVMPEMLRHETEKHLSGIVKEGGEINLGFKTPGQIEQIYVNEGNFIKAGQLVAKLDDKDYKLAVDALQIQFDQLNNEFSRISKLYGEKSISQNDYEKALAGLKQLQIQLQSNKNKLEYTRLTSPVDGYVQAVNFEPAEMVDAGTPVITLLDMNGMEVTTDIPAEIYSKRNNFKSIRCQTGDGAIYDMQLSSITPKADGNQLYRMRATFRSIPSGVTAGMNIETIITIADKDTTSTEFTLPLHSIFNDNGKDYVWTVEADTTVHKTAVTLAGMDSDGNAIVSAGLSGNEIVVKAGVEYLQDNDKVKIVNRTSETNIGNIL